MNKNDLIKYCKAEEENAYIHGWDFSHIHHRYNQESLPWDYKSIVLKYLNPTMKLLDTDTGGGEFLLSLNHPAENTGATEGYAPNVLLCKERLVPLGINFKEAADCSNLPFEDGQFDIVINRHGNFDADEIHRILKKDGLFITQQVGEDNDRELVELMLPGTPKAFHGLNLKNQSEILKKAGFSIIEGKETFVPIRFYDIGALVWFARIIQWEFPDFSVDRCIDELFKAQQILDENGCVSGRAHRYLITAKKVI